MFKKLHLLIFLFVISIPGFAQVDRTKLPKAGPAPVINIGEHESFQLKNGLKVFVVENHKLPRITFSLIIDIDPILEGENTGYISIAGSLLRTGTKKRTKDQLDKEIDFLGASLSTSASGITASGLERHKENIVEILSDIVLNSDFKQEEFEKIRKQVLSELATTKDDPADIAERVRAVVFYGKDFPYGEPQTEKSINSITLEYCKNYYQTYFRPNVAYLAIVGDITKDEAKALVEKYLGKWEKKEVPVNKYKTPKPPIVNKVALVDRVNSVQSIINAGYPIEFDVASPDRIKASVANLILGGSATGRLFMNLRESKAYTYGAYSWLSPDEVVGSFGAFTQVRNSVTDSAIAEIFNEMKKIRNEKVSVEELQKAKNYLSGNFIRELESPATIARFAINTERYNLPKDYYKNYLKNLADVTVEDVQEIVKKYIKPNNSHIIVVGNAEEIAANLAKFSVSGKIDYYDIWGDKYDPSLKKLPADLTAEKVFNRYVKAIGGAENVMKVKDRTMKMKGSVQGMDITVTMAQKYPNKFYQLIDAVVFQQKTIFDGENGKAEIMGQVQLLERDQLEYLRSNAIDAILDYSKYGFKTELSGMETIDGKETYKVTLISESGKKSTQYYDTETGYLVRTVSQISTPQGEFTQTIDMDDYREADGLKYPYKLNQSFGPETIELNVTSIEVNTGLSDNLFQVE